MLFLLFSKTTNILPLRWLRDPSPRCQQHPRQCSFLPRRVARARARSSCGRLVTAVGIPTHVTATATPTAYSPCRYRARPRAATSRGISRNAAPLWRPRIRRARPATTRVSPPWTWTPSCVPITSARWSTPELPPRRP